MNRWSPPCWIAIALLIAAGPASPATKEPPDALTVMERTERALEDLSTRVQPAVATVRRFERDEAWWAIAKNGGEGRPGWRFVPVGDRLYLDNRPCRGASGFAVSADGYLLTARRTVVEPRTEDPAEIVDVELGGEHYRAKIVSLEPTLDLAVLKIEPKGPIPFLRFGDSSKSRAGHWAIAFGDPDGTERTLVPGFIAVAPSRECYQDDLTATYFQTSTAVPEGAVGGPLVNLRGEVIGVNARLRNATHPDSLVPVGSCGYALPSNIANGILQSLLIRENMESPWIGISVLLPDDALRRKLGGGRLAGIYIDNVFDPSPASGAGIRVGDILRSMEGQPIATVYDFQRLLYFHGAGSRVRLGLVRDRKPLEVQVTIERRPRDAATR